MMLLKVIKRFMVPQLVTNLYYLYKFGALISFKAEVELSSNVKMGGDCVIGSFTKLKASDGPLIFGKRCGIGTGCFISTGEKGIEIGDNFICGPNVVMTASNYVFDKLDVHLEDQGHSSRGIRIGNNVWIGAGSVIVDGTVLKDNTVVVANSLVNRRFPEGAILQGNPAKVIMKRTRDA